MTGSPTPGGTGFGPASGEFDVAVIGGGVVGTAVARLAARSGLRVVLIERRADVGAGTSKANTAILHTGFDAVPGSMEARLVARGYGLLRDYAAANAIRVEPTGALLVAWSDEQVEALPRLAAKAQANGYDRTELVDRAAVRSLEPELGPEALAGMLVPDEHLIDPWAPSVRFATDALAAGAELRLGVALTGATSGPDVTHLTLEGANGARLVRRSGTDACERSSTVRARWVVNAAGLASDTVHRMFGRDGFTIRPRRGELIVFDKLARRLLGRTLLPVPTATTKGVLVAPTVFGNVMLGPTADDIEDRDATSTTADGLDRLLAQGRRILPRLIEEEITAVYAGLRAATEHSDYQLSVDPAVRYVCLGGIRSTGLSASMALAEEAMTLLGVHEPGFASTVAAADTHTAAAHAGAGPSRSGRIVCHCEGVTEGEIRSACSGALPAVDLGGLRRRTRTMNGRCQGFFCSAAVSVLTGFDPRGDPVPRP